MMKVLMLSPELPSERNPGSMAPAARQMESIRQSNVDVKIVDMVGWPVLKYGNGLWRMYRMAHNVDLIHAHFGYCGWLARGQLRKPVVLSLMGSDTYGDREGRDGTSDWFSASVAYLNRNWLAPKMDAVIVKSKAMANMLPHVTTHVIPNGVDTDVFRPIDGAAAREQLGWSSERKVVLFPGNPDNPRKGFGLATAAVDVANSLGTHNIELVPLWGISPNEVPLFMNACDLMLMVSVAEGSPNVVKEAMACNTPIVSVKVGDTAELLNNVAGCRVCERDPKEIGSAISQQIVRPVESEGRQAISRMRLDLASVAERVLAVYHSVVQQSDKVFSTRESSCQF